MSPADGGTVETLADGPASQQRLGRLIVDTRGQGFVEITREVGRWVGASGIASGLLTLFCRHTSASLTIQENADPDVRTDLIDALNRLAPREAEYVHRDEGPDDMPAHIRTMLTGSHLAFPVLDAKPVLGTWQGIYLIEHRDRPHRREIVLHLLGA